VGKEIYISGEYLEKNPKWHSEDSAWKTKNILKIIYKNNLQPKSIYEVGCGAGEMLNQLYLSSANDITFVGHEISPQAFELCQQKTKERLSFCLKDISQDQKVFYDIVLIIDVLEQCY